MIYTPSSVEYTPPVCEIQLIDADKCNHDQLENDVETTSPCSMIWVTAHSNNRSELLSQFSLNALLPSQVGEGWTYKTKPEIERGYLPFTSPDDPQLDLLEFMSPKLSSLTETVR